MESEAEILVALRSTERKERDRAECEIYQVFEPRVRAILSRVVGSGPQLDDATQEAFIDVFRGLSKFEGRSGLGTWIYRVALRRGWKCAAREKAIRERQVAGAPQVETAAAPANANALHARELAFRLESALKKLSYEHRSIIALAGLEGLSTAEVAETLGIPSGTVHSRLSRARAKLKELLGAE